MPPGSDRPRHGQIGLSGLIIGTGGHTLCHQRFLPRRLLPGQRHTGGGGGRSPAICEASRLSTSSSVSARTGSPIRLKMRVTVPGA
jgi:hypothetical protein